MKKAKRVQKNKKKSQLNIKNEESLSGHMADLNSDDDIVKQAKKIGLYVDHDQNHKPEVNIAKQVKQAEKKEEHTVILCFKKKIE